MLITVLIVNGQDCVVERNETISNITSLNNGGGSVYQMAKEVPGIFLDGGITSSNYKLSPNITYNIGIKGDANITSLNDAINIIINSKKTVVYSITVSTETVIRIEHNNKRTLHVLMYGSN